MDRVSTSRFAKSEVFAFEWHQKAFYTINDIWWPCTVHMPHECYQIIVERKEM